MNWQAVIDYLQEDADASLRAAQTARDERRPILLANAGLLVSFASALQMGLNTKGPDILELFEKAGEHANPPRK